MARSCQDLQRIRHNDESVLSNTQGQCSSIAVLVKEI
jgi:hypothetical protein